MVGTSHKRPPLLIRVQRKSFSLTFTSPNIISTCPQNVLMSRLISQFFCNLNSSKKFTCPSGKLITEFMSPIAKSTSPRLSDTTFFVRWRCNHFFGWQVSNFPLFLTSSKRPPDTMVWSLWRCMYFSKKQMCIDFSLKIFSSQYHYKL